MTSAFLRSSNDSGYKSKNLQHYRENIPGERRLLCAGKAIIKNVSAVNPLSPRSIKDQKDIEHNVTAVSYV